MSNTFVHDHTLPALPVSELGETCRALCGLIQPLLPPEGFAATQAALEEFRRTGGIGEKLHDRLREWRDSLGGNQSWLRPLWDDMYTSWRGPLPLEMNYFFRFRTKRWGGNAALPRLVRALGYMAGHMAAGILEPETTRNGPLAMDQVRTALYTRIPGKENDLLLPARLPGNETIGVCRRGHWFLLSLRREDGSLADEADLAAAFAAIRAHADGLPEAVPLAALTSAKRPEAAALREDLQQRPQNRLSLAALEQTLFVVCLDPAQTSSEAPALRLLGGDAACRWFDKSLQVIAADNGGLGANFEHAGCDAAIWLYLLNGIDAALVRGNEEETVADAAGRDIAQAARATEEGEGLAAPRTENALSHVPSEEGLWRILSWDVPENAARRLAALRREFARRLDDMRLVCREFPALSREALKELKTSPDAFMQIAFQAAQYRLFHGLRSTYEAVTMRRFAYGRTECARGGSMEALAFAKALRDGAERGTLRQLYREAEKTHLHRLMLCQKGLGAERHMFGLRAMRALHGEGPEPAVFSDPGWLALSHDSFSTSGLAAPFLRYFGFGPTVEDGIGIGYVANRESAALAVSGLRSGAAPVDGFVREFAEVSSAMLDLLRA